MNLPESAADELKKPINEDKKIIINPYHGIEILTRTEAIDLINHISGALLADECYNSKK